MGKVLTAAALAASAASIVAVGLLMGAHTPYRTDKAESGGLQFPRATRWRAIYVLAADCFCSTKVARHLAERGPLAGLEETVRFVGSEPETEKLLASAGLHVEKATAEQIHDKFGLNSAPVLLLVAPDGGVRYSGGFAKRSDFRDGFQEERLWRELAGGRDVQRLPAYGCALVYGCALRPSEAAKLMQK